MGCDGVRVERPEELGAAFRKAFSSRTRPVVIDVIVTRDPAQMLPAADSRSMKLQKGDRPV
jgi:acetolactate synthase I/II/III large subunit